MDTIVPTIKPKSNFEQALEQLDLNGCLALMMILNEKALFLSSKDTLLKKDKLIKVQP